MGSSVVRYISRHWRGELPLYVSFWVNGVLLHFVLAAILIALAAGGAMYSNDSAFDLLTVYGILALRLVAVWQLIGIWRSAQSASRFARVARACVGIGWLYFAAVTVGMIGSIGNIRSRGTRWMNRSVTASVVRKRS
jgi:hypothetical protein